MRDPGIYRIIKANHPRTGSAWCIYPMYDYAHCISDSIERITHSICTLEFEAHRPLYDWFLDELGLYHPQQIEFARLNLTYTVMSKRRLLQLVEEGHVAGWDDPRMPTIAGLRRRGFTPQAIQNFCKRIGVAKTESTVDYALLEHCLRDDLNKRAPRVMAVLDPLKVVITNYPEEQSEELNAVNNPEDESMGSRPVPFSREIYIERNDFMEDPPKKFYRLAPGREVRLRYGYYITCQEVIKDADGSIVELRCTYDPETRGGTSPDGRKVKATIHWVSIPTAVKAEVRLYDYLFTKSNPYETDAVGDFTVNINPESLTVVPHAYVEPSVSRVRAEEFFQFERLGYFCVDKDSSPDHLIFNRTTPLRDTWAKIAQKG
jgi:glutaminyl-tRNA synthetase